MSNNLNNLETAVEGFLAKEANPTPAKIRELIQNFRVVPTCSVSDSEADFLARRFEVRHAVTMTLGAVLTGKEHTPWLEPARSKIDPYYWSRYRNLLRDRHFSGQVIATLDDVTDRILGLLENPHKDGPWDRRGMVVGHVQSGKTANYTGLICKAADAGYKLVVVIAGLNNNLRNQTQLRIDEGFVGRDSARLLSQKGDRFVGVGRYDQTRRPVTFTNSVRDFSKTMATSVGIPLQNLKEPAVFVIKKNPTTLKNLIDWLREHSAGRTGKKVDAPILLIDDEADNASINIAYKKDDVSRINGQIREILELFSRSCYIGYTATPFANIFIDPNSDDEMLGQDLFPRNFIVSLDPPTNYFGPNRVFLDSSGSVVRNIDDHEDLLPLRHKIDHQILRLPPSLLFALRAFIIARAIRLFRGHLNEHCSMLVNASRFTLVQRQLRNEIHARLERLQASARIHGALPREEAMLDPEINALYEVWNMEYMNSGPSWMELLPFLNEAAAPVRVVEVNSRSSGSLNYADHVTKGMNVIAVGGFSLSRGLTLEGLMTSYFLRNSMMYDTLMQMGRWFGYRTDYEDLCRVWMPEAAESWYCHIAESIEMLRDELRRMEAAGATPEEFGLKVRSHPDTLIVTARNKFGSGESVVVNIGLGNHFVETATLKRANLALNNNRSAAARFSNSLARAGKPLASAERVSNGFLLRNFSVGLIKDFLGDFDNHPASVLTDPEPVIRYIEDREEGELQLWDLLVVSLQNDLQGNLSEDLLGVPVICQQRTAGGKSNATTLRITNSHRVSSRGVEKAGLSLDTIQAAEAAFRIQSGIPCNGTANYPDRIYRAVRNKPLLILHLLQIVSPPNGPEHPIPVVAWSISFPPTSTEEKKVQYIVNATWLQENYGIDLEDEEMDGE